MKGMEQKVEWHPLAERLAEYISVFIVTTYVHPHRTSAKNALKPSFIDITYTLFSLYLLMIFAERYC